MRYIIGIDEVGRGALAGPVVVAAVMMPKSLINLKLHSRTFANKNSEPIREVPLRDSKKLSAVQRERWDTHLRNHPRVHFALARVNPRGIERMNISRAANLAAVRAYRRLVSRITYLVSSCRVYLDGGLYLGNSPGRDRGLTQTPRGTARIIRRQSAYSPRLSAFTIVKGDEKIPAISVASIIAKVHRDRSMTRLAKKYPQYGFAMHKGYGTKAHLLAIKKYGACNAHRLTFISPYITMNVKCKNQNVKLR